MHDILNVQCSNNMNVWGWEKLVLELWKNENRKLNEMKAHEILKEKQ